MAADTSAPDTVSGACALGVSTKFDGERLEALFHSHADVILAFGLRRGLSLDRAEDLVAETFSVAWKKLAEVPDDPRYWLIAVARNVLANMDRGERRREKLRARLAGLWEAQGSPGRDPAETVDTHARMREAFARLSDWDREALSLLAWDGLTSAEAAEAMGCTTQAFSVKIARARSRLVKEMARSGHLSSREPSSALRTSNGSPDRKGV
jgi:RNA polymerase sigma factor (sigma-70 family)